MNLVDSKNRKPIDIAIHRNNFNIVDILKENTNILSCNFNQQKANDNWIYPIGFFLYFFLYEIILVFVVLPYLQTPYRYEISICLFGLIILFYIKLFFSNPGYKKKINKTLDKLLTEGENLTKICPYCVSRTPNVTRHCYYCKKCVESHDHHCIWIRNCIGKNNYLHFFIFLFLISFKLILGVYYALQSIN